MQYETKDTNSKHLIIQNIQSKTSKTQQQNHRRRIKKSLSDAALAQLKKEAEELHLIGGIPLIPPEIAEEEIVMSKFLGDLILHFFLYF